MVRLAAGKLLRVFGILAGVTIITFLLMHAIPGNPWDNYSTAPTMVQGFVSTDVYQREISKHFGLDLPLWRQYTRYILGDFNPDGSFICGVVCGNLGPSLTQRGRSVQDILFKAPEDRSAWDSRFGYSIRLVLLSFLIAVGLGIPIGLLISNRPNGAFSRAVSIGLAALISIPNFVLGLLAIIVLATVLHVINVLADWSQPSSWIVPAVVLAVMPMSSIARVTQAAVVNTIHEDYVRTAYGKGLTNTAVMLKHVLRNALIPVVMFVGPTLMELFTGLFVVESLFAFPGFGNEYWLAVLRLDYPMIMGMTIVYAIGILGVNLLIEIACNALDPRLRDVQRQGTA